MQWLDNGELQYIGRTDQQVKIRGYRIEPAEIEQTMLSVAGIVQVVVLPRSREVSRRDLHRYDYLVAWYIADQPIDDKTLRNQLNKKLPAYMVPAAYVAVKQFPDNCQRQARHQGLARTGITRYWRLRCANQCH